MCTPTPSLRWAPIIGAFGCGVSLLTGGCSTTAPTPIPPTDPPSISCPAGQTAQSVDGNPVAVTYADPTFTGGQSPFTLACTPVSGATYPVGATTVTCTVTDAQHRTSNCTFPVTVVMPPPPHLSVTTFVAFGDSMTWGEDGRITNMLTQSQRGKAHPLDRFPEPERYPSVVRQELTSRYRAQSFTVDNAGQPRESVTDLLTLPRFASVVDGGQYAVVLIMEGANDLGKGAGIEPAAIAGLSSMIAHARVHGVRPYLATIPPEFDGCCPMDRGSAHLLVPGFNDLVRGLAVQQAVPLVDVYTALNTNVTGYIGPDGLHPTADGYAKIADTFFTVIKNTLETAQPGGSNGLRGSPPRSGSFAVPAPAGRGSRVPVRKR
jgi:lysophospholipase L1-like esterase